MANPFASLLDDLIVRPLDRGVDFVFGLPSTSSPTNPWQTTVQPSVPGDVLDRSSRAIASIEGGRYDLLGPVVERGPYRGQRALGKYQVMPGNLGQWLSEAGLPLMSPQEFLGSPETQEALFRFKFGQYLSRYGNPIDAAQAWFGGPGTVGRPETLGRTDRTSRHPGLTIGQYRQRFEQGFREGPGSGSGSVSVSASPITTGSVSERRTPMPENDPLAYLSDPELQRRAENRGPAPLTLSSILDTILGPPRDIIREGQQQAGALLRNRESLRAANQRALEERDRETAASEAAAKILQRTLQIRGENQNTPPRQVLLSVLADPEVVSSLGRIPVNQMNTVIQQVTQWAAADPQDALRALTARRMGLPLPGPAPQVAGPEAETSQLPGATAGPSAGPGPLGNLSPSQVQSLEAGLAVDPQRTLQAAGDRFRTDAFGPAAPDDFTLTPGQTRFSGRTGQPIASLDPTDPNATAVAGQRAQMVRTMAEGLPRAEALASDLVQLSELSKQIGSPNWGTAITRFAMDRGLPAGTTAEQTFQSVVSRLAPRFREAGSGPLSDADMRLLLQGIGSITQTPATRQRLIGSLTRAAEVNLENSRDAQQYILGDQPSNAVLNRIRERNEAFTKETKDLLDALRKSNEGVIDVPGVGPVRRRTN